MNVTRILAAAALAAAMALPAAAEAQTSGSPPAGFPWLRYYGSRDHATSQAARNADAAIRWQETINSYSRGR